MAPAWLMATGCAPVLVATMAPDVGIHGTSNDLMIDLWFIATQPKVDDSCVDLNRKFR